MAYIALIIISLVISITSCVPTDTARINPNERIYLDVSIQYSSKHLKATAQTYAEDSLGRRPYFLQKDIRLGGEVMQRQYQNHKGVYYEWEGTWEGDTSISVVFYDLDGEKYEEKLSLLHAELKDWPAEFRWSDMTQISMPPSESLLLIDQQNRLQEWKSGRSVDTSQLSKGELQVAQLLRKDTTYEMKNKRWMRYQIKSISDWTKSQLIE